MSYSEKQIKDRLIKYLEERGYYTLLLVATNKPGIPDVLAIDTKSHPIFIEVKRPGLKARKLQEYRMQQLRDHGVKAFVFDGDFTELESILGHVQ